MISLETRCMQIFAAAFNKTHTHTRTPIQIDRTQLSVLTSTCLNNIAYRNVNSQNRCGCLVAVVSGNSIESHGNSTKVYSSPIDKRLLDLFLYLSNSSRQDCSLECVARKTIIDRRLKLRRRSAILCSIGARDLFQITVNT